MSVVNPDQEILEFAISKEMEAHHFYSAIARHVDTARMRDVFEQLAAEELAHKARLELEIVKAGRVVRDGREPEAGADSDYIMAEPDTLLDMDYKDMLLLAMEKEGAAFRTYVGLLAQAREEQTQELLLALAEQEVKHKLRFEAEYDLLLK